MRGNNQFREQIVPDGQVQSHREYFIRQGYMDAVRGDPFHADYDKWPPFDQLNYERARIYATSIIERGWKLPPWPIGAPHPAVFWRMVTVAAQQTGGDPLPLEKAQVLEKREADIARDAPPNG